MDHTCRYSESGTSPQQVWLADAVDKFHSMPLYESNPQGDCVWAALIEGLDNYRVGDPTVVENQLYVSRMNIMCFEIPELDALDVVKELTEADREGLDQFFDDAAEGDFLRRVHAAAIMKHMIGQNKRGADVNDVDEEYYEPMYQLIESWGESDTNCLTTPFFESDLFRECWGGTTSKIPEDKIATIFTTFFWYRKREHGGTYAVAATDAQDLAYRIASCCERLGWKGVERLGLRAKSRFDEQQAVMDEIESQKWEELLHGD